MNHVCGVLEVANQYRYALVFQQTRCRCSYFECRPLFTAAFVVSASIFIYFFHKLVIKLINKLINTRATTAGAAATTAAAAAAAAATTTARAKTTTPSPAPPPPQQPKQATHTTPRCHGVVPAIIGCGLITVLTPARASAERYQGQYQTIPRINTHTYLLFSVRMNAHTYLLFSKRINTHINQGCIEFIILYTLLQKCYHTIPRINAHTYLLFSQRINTHTYFSICYFQRG